MRGRGASAGGRAVAAALAASALLAASAPAAAQHHPAQVPDWAFGEPAGEIAVALVSVASLGAYFLPQRRTGWGAYAGRDADAQLGLISDFTGAGLGTLLLTTQTYTIEGTYLLNAGAPDPFARALRTSLIDLEASALSSGIVMAVKRISGRCRPRAWRDGRCGDDDEDYVAFPSGHTTPVASIAGVHLSLALRTSGPTATRLGAFALAEGVTLVTMALRVGAGAHSWEDVGAGWILGHVIGVVMGYVHPIVDLPPAGPAAAPAPTASVVRWTGRF